MSASEVAERREKRRGTVGVGWDEGLGVGSLDAFAPSFRLGGTSTGTTNLRIIIFFSAISQVYKEYSFPKNLPLFSECTERKDKNEEICHRISYLIRIVLFMVF